MPKMWVKTGGVYGHWTVLDARPNKSLCVCRCTTQTLVSNRHLRRGKDPKCTDCHVANNANLLRNKVRPVLRKYDSTLEPAIYRRLRGIAYRSVWRCTDPTFHQWKDYGGRGISVWQPWIDDLSSFIQYLSTLPGHDNFALGIDREDNDGNYEPGNLRFVTRVVSTSNRRNSIAKRLAAAT